MMLLAAMRITSVREVIAKRGPHRTSVISSADIYKLKPLAIRSFMRNNWNFSGESHEDHSDSHSNSSSLVSPYGDNSPTPSPLIILPTLKRPVFPGLISIMTLKDPATIEAIVENKTVSKNYLGVFLRNNSQLPAKGPVNSEVITDISEIYPIGTLAQVHNIVRTDAGTQLFLLGHRRMTIQSIDSYGPPAIASVRHWTRPVHPKEYTDRIKAYVNEILSAARDLIKYSPLLQEQLQMTNWMARVDVQDPYKLADACTALVNAESWELQPILEAENIEDRLKLVLELLAKEKELLKIQKEINQQVEEKVSKQQREYFLREQLKSIKRVRSIFTCGDLSFKYDLFL